MASNNIPNKNTAQALDQKVIAGVTKYFSKVKSITVAGTTYTSKTLMAVFQADIDASTQVDAIRAQLKQLVASYRTTKANAKALRAELKTYILGNYGKAAVQMLEDFGMSAPKAPGKMTAATRAAAVVKAEATRKARGTMGSKEKQSIHGAPTTPASTETSSQAAPAATPLQGMDL